MTSRPFKKCLVLNLKASFIFKLFKFLQENVGKWLDKKAKVNTKIYEVINSKTSNYNTHINRYLKK